MLRKGTLRLTHRHHRPGLCQDDLVAEGVTERAGKGLHSGLAEPLRTYAIWEGLAFASPICRAPQGWGVSAEAWAKEQTCKLLSIYLLVKGLGLGWDSIVLMCSEHQGLPRKDKSLTVRDEPPNPSLETSPVNSIVLTRILPFTYFKVCPPPPPSWHGASSGD